MDVLILATAIFTLSSGLLRHTMVSGNQERLQYVVDGEGYADKLVEVLKTNLKKFIYNTSLPDNVYSIHFQDDYYELSLLNGKLKRVDYLLHSDALYEYSESHRLGMSITLGTIEVQYTFSLREVDSSQEYSGTITQDLSGLQINVVVAAYQDLDGQYVSMLGDYRLKTEGAVMSVDLRLFTEELPPLVLDQVILTVRRGYSRDTALRIGSGLQPSVAASIDHIDFGNYITQIP